MTIDAGFEISNGFANVAEGFFGGITIGSDFFLVSFLAYAVALISRCLVWTSLGNTTAAAEISTARCSKPVAPSNPAGTGPSTGDAGADMNIGTGLFANDSAGAGRPIGEAGADLTIGTGFFLQTILLGRRLLNFSAPHRFRFVTSCVRTVLILPLLRTWWTSFQTRHLHRC